MMSHFDFFGSMLDQMRDRDTLVLTLQTFSLSPIISFKDVHLGEIRTKRLYIENPSNSEVEVIAKVCFREEIDLVLNWLCAKIAPQFTAELDITWTPKFEGIWTQRVQITDGVTFWRDILVCLKAVDPYRVFKEKELLMKSEKLIPCKKLKAKIKKASRSKSEKGLKQFVDAAPEGLQLKKNRSPLKELNIQISEENTSVEKVCCDGKENYYEFEPWEGDVYAPTPRQWKTDLDDDSQLPVSYITNFLQHNRPSGSGVITPRLFCKDSSMEYSYLDENLPLVFADPNGNDQPSFSSALSELKILSDIVNNAINTTKNDK